MDVALDANEFLADPKMESIRFQSLLSYLRKTDSGLIIPRVVWDEVIARYPERISKPYNKATEHLSSLRAVALSMRVPRIPDLNVDQELRVLRQKLRKPSKRVRSRLLDNFGDVDVKEVARRGIARIPPANPQGEELRDVIVWLMMIAHAKKSGTDVAFITQDQHFRHGDSLHPELSKELKDGSIQLHFYPSIDDFIKAHAPSPHLLNEDEAFALIGKRYAADLFEIEARRFFPRKWGSASVEVVERSVSFVRGALYAVGGNAKYGEIEFGGQLHLRVVREEHTFINMLSPQTVQLNQFKAGVPAASPSAGYTFYSPEPQQDWYIPLDSTDTEIFTPPGTFSVNYGTTTPGSFTYVYPTSRPITRTTESVVIGKLEVSLRLVSDKTTKIEVERFELTEHREPPEGAGSTVSLEPSSSAS